MGNDGGSIPKRRELVKEAARLPTVSELKATALEALTHAWQTDPVTGDPLDLDHVVSDWRGRLYNYETVLEGLVGDDEKKETHEAFAATGIRSLRDVVRLHPSASTSISNSTSTPTTSTSSSSSSPWQCPVSLKELGPNSKAVYLVPCGHVFAEKVVAVLRDEEERQCPTCSATFASDDVVPVLTATTDEAERTRLERRRRRLREAGLTHSLKKDKSHKDGKKKKRKAEEAEGEPEKDNKKNGKEKKASNGLYSRINNAATASLTAKVLAEQEALHKRRKLGEAV